MSTREAGQLLLVGFEGTVAPPELLARIWAGRVGGVILFARNLGRPDEVFALTRALGQAVPAGAPPLIIAVDQEGGRVQRVKAPFTLWPPMARLGATGDEALAEEVGRAMAAELAALGFNLDFAPVLDVHTNPSNPIIGDRAFGTVPAEAARMALAYWRGLEAGGVRGCGKHFPGHGDTATDSHLELPHVDATLERLREVELLPFARAAEAGVGMFMTAHVRYPTVDEAPATLSSRWLTDLLRGELGFQGVVVSDDLDMKAMAAWDPGEAAVRSLLAGADCFLACRDPQIQAQAEQALNEAAAARPEVAVRLEESVARLARFRAGLRPLPDDAEGWRALPLERFAALRARCSG